jgi:hypothetical protein
LPLSYLASALRGLLDLAATKISAGMIISGLVQQKATTSVLFYLSPVTSKKERRE